MRIVQKKAQNTTRTILYAQSFSRSLVYLVHQLTVQPLLGRRTNSFGAFRFECKKGPHRQLLTISHSSLDSGF